MQSRSFISGFVLAAAFGVACSDASGPNRTDELVGSWHSSGLDLAPALRATYGAALVTATFNADRTYSIATTDSANVVTTVHGTWSASGAQRTVRSLTLVQSAPSELTSKGIFQIDGARLMLEVVQAQPAVAALVPPTIASGFGASARDASPVAFAWVQRYAADADAVVPCGTSDGLGNAKRSCDWTGWNPYEGRY